MKQLLGHSKLSTTEKYMHELESQQREARTKIENLIWFPKKKASGQWAKTDEVCGPMWPSCNCCK